MLPDLDAALGQPLLQTLPQITFELGAVDNSDEYTPADNAPFEATVEEIVDGPFEVTEEEQVDSPSEVAEEEEVEALLQVMDEELVQVAPVSRLTSVVHGHVYRHSVFSEDLSRFQKNSEARRDYFWPKVRDAFAEPSCHQCSGKGGVIGACGWAYMTCIICHDAFCADYFYKW